VLFDCYVYFVCHCTAVSCCIILFEKIFSVIIYSVETSRSNYNRCNYNEITVCIVLRHRPDLGFRIVCEQVSHHPPVSAFHAESEHFLLHGSIHPKMKFWGKSVEVTPKGIVTLHLLRFRQFMCCQPAVGPIFL